MSFHLYSFRDNSTPCEWELHVIAACGKEGNWHAHERYLGSYGRLATYEVCTIHKEPSPDRRVFISVLGPCQLPAIGWPLLI